MNNINKPRRVHVEYDNELARAYVHTKTRIENWSVDKYACASAFNTPALCITQPCNV